MDELEWLKRNSPSTGPSRDTTRRHRNQLRAAIATEGADGTGSRRPRRPRARRHRVLVTTGVVVAVCAVGAAVIALTSSGGEHGSEVGAPAAGDATTVPAPARACAGAPPRALAIPAGFGAPVAVPAAEATAAPEGTQQVTSWTSGAITIEQRWPADTDVAARLTDASGLGDSLSSSAETQATVEKNGVAHRAVVFTFGSQAPGCAHLQATVYGRDVQAVESVTDGLIEAPFVSNQPLVTTTGAAASAPAVVACDGPVRLAVATVGDTVVSGATFAQPADALGSFLQGRKALAHTGYQELRIDDASIVYVKDVEGRVVTTVHVAPTPAGWVVTDWRASGC